MKSDDPSNSARTDSGPTVQLWPLPESEIADAETLLKQVHFLLAQIEQTIYQARIHLASLDDAAPALRQSLVSGDLNLAAPPLADLQSARSLRAELVKAAQETVTVSQTAAKYLQAREQFLLTRHAWKKRVGK